jgi:hypothetical protein
MTLQKCVILTIASPVPRYRPIVLDAIVLDIRLWADRAVDAAIDLVEFLEAAG